MTALEMQAGQCWVDVADVLAAGVGRVLLYGPPGTGKTYAALKLGLTHGISERLVCTEDLTTGEITGTWLPAGASKWEWREGPAIRAWRANGGRGGRLVVDEVDRASGDALSTRWRNPETGQWVKPGPDFSVVMTTNAEDLEDIPAALRDRFPVTLRIDRPHPNAVATLSDDLKEPALHGSLGDAARRVSLRSFYAFDQLRAHLGAPRAARLLFGEVHGQAILDALSIGALE